MAIQFNDITRIGDVFEIQTQTPIIGIQSVSGFTDVILGETAVRFFYKEFRYSVNGITYTDWKELTDQALIDTFIPGTSIFDIQYRYTREGTDSTGFLTFISIELQGLIVEQENPRIFTDIYFNKFFNYNDSSVLKWALNVLDKLHKRGIVANYVTRNQDGVNDDDFLSFFGALTHFFAILVRYAREFKDFTLNDILLTEYLRQKGVFVSDGMTISDLQSILYDVYSNFMERGTNEISKGVGIDGRTIDEELLRLLRKGEFDEFIFGLIESEKTIWNLNNNSPMYRGNKESYNLIKAYEFSEDVTNLSSYPLIESSFVTKYTDSGKEVIRILDAEAVSGTIISGIGDAKLNSKLILIDSRLSYEITFQVKQAVLGDYFSMNVNLYDEDEVLLSDSPISAITGVQTNNVFSEESLLRDDLYYFIRVILFNENIGVSASNVLDIGFGNHLTINNSGVKFMSIELGVETFSGGTWEADNDLRIFDFKVRPLMISIANGFVMVPNIINSFLENNSEQTNIVVENKIKRYLLPYNSVFNNQFLDELFVPANTPLRIVVSSSNETTIGFNNGTITIVASGGVLPYKYSIDNGATFQSTGYFSNLAPSTYLILVEDEEGVQVTDTVVISVGSLGFDFNLFPILSSRLDVSDGKIQVSAFGGTSPYFYSIDNVGFSVNSLISNLLSGNYTVYVRDTSGAQLNKTIFLDSIRNKTVTFVILDELSVVVSSVNVNIAELSENYSTNGSGIAVMYLQNGLYNFNLSKTGYKPISSSYSITEDRIINVMINTYYVITFVVKNTSNEELGNTLIQTLLTPTGQSSFSVSTPSNSGIIAKLDVISGSYSFLVSRADYNDEIVSVSITGNQTVNIELDETLYNITFIVKDMNGVDIPDALISTTSTPVGQASFSVSTPSPNGAVIKSDIKKGNYSFIITKGGFITATANLNVVINSTLNVVLQYGTFIYGSPGDYIFVVPSFINSIKVECIGGGASGSGVAFVSSGSGGAGATYSSSIISVTGGTSYNLSVGAGGKNIGESYPISGNNSSFNSGLTPIVVANGGLTQQGSVAGSIGAVIRIGGNGADGGSSVWSGAGGGAACNNVGGNAVLGVKSGGVGGGGYAGDGGDGVSCIVNSSGNSGRVYGGGGSGANRISTGTSIGGSGAGGIIIITVIS